ncbi:hypothetical protein IV38_GL001168 [Lactobacillus selangorensis]|uniref:Cas12f1-like TNB domain-containing protein n=1 Tax=Lactobacillus selangorensis TaxID=81857 RepID=A0A0R2FUP8_9LACO|nr:zinc ribbon domain-containing protein [Lactobacillus selangorensis]KRN28956.1 hypothetical protein IV38_GL001168 [Lactobacillus selangorensis]KRN32634.1 hypothetical protein IV40_GL000685 [Lactobacillus selangorensis]
MANKIKHIVGIDLGTNYVMTCIDEQGHSLFISGIQLRQAQVEEFRRFHRQHKLSAEQRKYDQQKRELIIRTALKTLFNHYPKETLFVVENLAGQQRIAAAAHRRPQFALRFPYLHIALELQLMKRAPSHGSQVWFINPRETSHRCPRCHYINKANRESAEHLFICKNCGFEANDDLTAAINIFQEGKSAFMAASKQTTSLQKNYANKYNDQLRLEVSEDREQLSLSITDAAKQTTVTGTLGRSNVGKLMEMLREPATDAISYFYQQHYAFFITKLGRQILLGVGPFTGAPTVDKLDKAAVYVVNTIQQRGLGKILEQANEQMNAGKKQIRQNFGVQKTAKKTTLAKLQEILDAKEAARKAAKNVTTLNGEQMRNAAKKQQTNPELKKADQQVQKLQKQPEKQNSATAKRMRQIESQTEKKAAQNRAIQKAQQKDKAAKERDHKQVTEATEAARHNQEVADLFKPESLKPEPKQPASAAAKPTETKIPTDVSSQFNDWLQQQSFAPAPSSAAPAPQSSADQQFNQILGKLVQQSATSAASGKQSAWMTQQDHSLDQLLNEAIRQYAGANQQQAQTVQPARPANDLANVLPAQVYRDYLLGGAMQNLVQYGTNQDKALLDQAIQQLQELRQNIQ